MPDSGSAVEDDYPSDEEARDIRAFYDVLEQSRQRTDRDADEAVARSPA